MGRLARGLRPGVVIDNDDDQLRWVFFRLDNQVRGARVTDFSEMRRTQNFTDGLHQGIPYDDGDITPRIPVTSSRRQHQPWMRVPVFSSAMPKPRLTLRSYPPNPSNPFALNHKACPRR